jgi:Protein of unknown function (DUF3000)
VPHSQTLKRAGRPVASQPGAEEFRRAVAEVAAGIAEQRALRPELMIEDEPPPRRLAQFAYAVAATVCAGPVPGSAAGSPVGRPSSSSADPGPPAAGPADRGDRPGAGTPEAELGWGKFVLLFDVAGQPGWDGKYRIIGYVRAELEPEMAADPLINAVGWSWLTEALDARSSGYRKISGTVTSVVTKGFGAKQDDPTSTGFELRASWSPVLSAGTSADLDGHVAAWCDVMCMAAGLPPLPPGVTALRSPAGRPAGTAQRRRPRQ